MIKALESSNKRGPLKAWEADCIKVFWEAHYSHILAHHHNEDGILVPFLKTRFTYPEKVRPSRGRLETLTIVVFCRATQQAFLHPIISTAF
jgi:hypothetical protein